jgi:hypothetical protein
MSETATVICSICGKPLPVEGSTCNGQNKPVHELCYAAEVVSALRSVSDESDSAPDFEHQLGIKKATPNTTFVEHLRTWLSHLKNVA